MFRKVSKILIFNIASLLLAGLVTVGFIKYLEETENRPICAVCENNSLSGYMQPSNSPKDDYSDSLYIDGMPDGMNGQVAQTTYDIPQNARHITSLDCSFVVDITKEWLENPELMITGAQYDITFQNNTIKEMSDWVIQFTVPNGSMLDSSWSGEYTYENAVVTVKPLDYNREILPGENITFGFIMHTPGSAYRIQDCTIVYYCENEIWQYPLFWVIIVFLFALLVGDVAYMIAGLRIRKYKQRRIADLRIIEQSLSTFANIIDAKDEYTKGHSLRVAYYSREIAKRMNMDEETQQQLYYIALLHDIGKIGISDNILQKPGALTPDERVNIQQHVTIGGEILKDFSSIPGIAEGAMYHHERYDGKGYATGLKGKEIPLFARIICVADAFDAMSSARCYRGKLNNDFIINELKENSGSQFDPEIAEYMLDMIREGVAPAVDIA